MAVKKRQVKKAVKFAKKYPKIFVAIAVVLVVAFVLYCYFNPDFYNRLFNQNIKPPMDNEVTTVTTLNDLEIHIIDVGQGDAILIKAPDGKTIMFDAAKDGKKYEEPIYNYFQAHNVTTINYFIATHPDADHIGSADYVFEITNVKKVFRPYIKHKNTSSTNYSFTNEFNQGNIEHATGVYGKFLQCILDEKYGNNIACEWEFFTDDSDFANSAKFNDVEYTYTFDFLTPTTSLSSIKYSDVNNYSPIVMLEYCGFKMIFTGDAHTQVEEEFYLKYNNQTYVDCDVLKVGHHGSNTSTSENFLNLIKPEKAVISANYQGNTYNHPHQSTLYKLRDLGCAVFRTDTNGNILIKVNKDGEYTITCENNDFAKNYDSPDPNS